MTLPQPGEYRVWVRTRDWVATWNAPGAPGKFQLLIDGTPLATTFGTEGAEWHWQNGGTVRLGLGGNASSEVRVWPEGHTRQEPFPTIGEIVEEICPPRKFPGNQNAKSKELYDDDRKLAVVRAEPRITLLLEHRVNAIATRDNRILSVTAQQIRTARRVEVKGTLFADCTGDATVGYLAGADFEVSSEGRMGASNLWNVLDQADRDQVLTCECKDKEALSVLAEAGKVEAVFPRLPWALDLSEKPFPGRSGLKEEMPGKPIDHLGGWFWESGFDKDPIEDIERIRDLNLRAMYGAWDTLKNIDKMYPNHRLGRSAFIAGKRESRRLLGDVLLAGQDFHEGKQWPDHA